jgi:hypothetical protein
MLGVTPAAGEPEVRPLPGAPALRVEHVRVGSWMGELTTDAAEPTALHGRRRAAG